MNHLMKFFTAFALAGVVNIATAEVLPSQPASPSPSSVAHSLTTTDLTTFFDGMAFGLISFSVRF